MEEFEFKGSFITYTPGYVPAPFELVLGERYHGNQQLTDEEARAIADFIYDKLKRQNHDGKQ